MDPTFYCKRERNLADQAFIAWWKVSTSVRDQLHEAQGNRRDLDVCVLREQLTQSLEIHSITRPSTVPSFSKRY